MKTPTMLKKEQDLTTADVFTAVGAARTIEHGLLARLDALAAKRAHLVGALEWRAVMVPKLEAQVDALAVGAVGAVTSRLLSAGVDRVISTPGGEPPVIRPGDLRHVFEMDPATLCLLVPDLVKASLKKLVDAATFAEGPPMEDRARLIAEVDAEIAHVEREHQALVLSAGGVGLVLEELPANRGKRVAAERQAEEARKLAVLNRLDKGTRAEREAAWNARREEEYLRP